MPTEENVATARALLDLYNSRDFDRLVTLVTDDLELMNAPTGDVFRGPAGYRQMLEAWTAAMPDVHVQIDNLIAAGDWVTVECIGQGSVSGALTLPSTQMPPTGQRVESRFCLVLHFRDGKIDRSRGYFDMSGMR
jgi:steroid delta-isomerase-like uncharacterized protein